MPETSFDDGQGPQAPPPPPAPVIQMPWENPGAGAKEFFYTLWGIISKPSWALSARPAASWPRWVGFTLLLWLLIMVVMLVGHFIQEGAFSLSGTLIILLLLIIILPFQALILLPVQAWIARFTLSRLAKGGDYPSFPMVFRLVCYSQVAGLAGFVPIIGTWAVPIWSVYLLAIGLHVGLGQGKRSAFLAALAPVLIMTLFIFLFIGTLVAGV